MNLRILEESNRLFKEKLSDIGIQSLTEEWEYIDFSRSSSFSLLDIDIDKLVRYYESLNNPEMLTIVNNFIWFYEAIRGHWGGKFNGWVLHYRERGNALELNQKIEDGSDHMDKDKFKEFKKTISKKGYKKQLREIQLKIAFDQQAADRRTNELMVQIVHSYQREFDRFIKDLKEQIQEIIEEVKFKMNIQTSTTDY